MPPASDVTKGRSRTTDADPLRGRPMAGRPSTGARTAGVGASVRQHPALRRDASGHGARVLLVDDDDALAEMLSLVLRNE
jgi:hypothetical protein